MDIPSFHAPQIPVPGERLLLDEDGSRHAVSVLRLREGEAVRLVDGQGVIAHAGVVDAHRKRCVLAVRERKVLPDPRYPLTLAVSLLKNPSRFEWMLEKVCEIGVRRVVPLLLHRTERQRVRQDRLAAVALSAMLQSQQPWMTEVTAPMALADILSRHPAGHRLIAHCLPGSPAGALAPVEGEALVLIGPEGDFTPAEVDAALGAGFRPVRLGPSRLRSETAGVVAAAVLCIAHSSG